MSRQALDAFLRAEAVRLNAVEGCYCAYSECNSPSFLVKWLDAVFVLAAEKFKKKSPATLRRNLKREAAYLYPSLLSRRVRVCVACYHHITGYCSLCHAAKLPDQAGHCYETNRLNSPYKLPVPMLKPAPARQISTSMTSRPPPIVSRDLPRLQSYGLTSRPKEERIEFKPFRKEAVPFFEPQVPVSVQQARHLYSKVPFDLLRLSTTIKRSKKLV